MTAAASPVRSWRGRWWLAGALLALLLVGSALAAALSGHEGMGAAAAVLLGLVEGLTEWLPISSTGHLTVTQALLGLEGPAADSYAIAIQAGAILAVLGLYGRRVRGMVAGALGRDPAGRHLLLAVAIAAAPAAVAGLALEDAIKARLFGPWPVVIAWVVGGVVILVVARRRRDVAPGAGRALASLRYREALIIGLAQILALWPGTSRSLVTILAATLVGLSVPAAVEFSFLLGFVVLGGATAYEALSSGATLAEAYGVVTPLLGLGVAFLSALAAMRWMVAYLTSHGLGVFGWYRLGIGAVVATLLVTGVLAA